MNPSAEEDYHGWGQAWGVIEASYEPGNREGKKGVCAVLAGTVDDVIVEATKKR